LIPNLYRGDATEEENEARHHMINLEWLDAAKDVAASGEYLLSTGSPKVGVMGFCVGGALTIIAASQRQPSLSAACCYYGYIPDDRLGDPSNIIIPVQVQFAMKDHCKGFADAPTGKILEQKLKKGKVNYEIIWWVTGHSFMNENYVLRRAAKYPEPYDPDIAKISLKKCAKFFQNFLSASGSSPTSSISSTSQSTSSSSPSTSSSTS